MVENQNVEIINRIVEDTKVTPQTIIPNNISNSIQPVLISNPKEIVNVVKSKTSAGTIYTTPTDKDFYLTYVHLSSLSHNVGATSGNYITITLEDGTAEKIIADGLGSQAATDLSNTSGVAFAYPIKLKRGTNITLTIGGGTTSCTGIIAGFNKDVLKKI